MVIEKHTHHQTAFEVESSECVITFSTIQSLSVTCPLSPVQRRSPHLPHNVKRYEVHNQQRACTPLLVFTR